VSEQAAEELDGSRLQRVLAGRLSLLGARLGLGWLTYNPLQMLIYHQYATRDAQAVIHSFEEVFREARSYVDVGCGSGAYAAEATRRGHSVVGLERSLAGRLIARRQGVDCRHFDLRRPLPMPDTASFDVAYCFEVAEHLPQELGESLVDVICRFARKIVFSAAPPGQGGVGHINEQPPDYWHIRFAANGFDHSPSASLAMRESFARNGVWAPWLKTNTTVYIGSD
jgi:SAM-dependent methyltransferase